MRSMHGYILVYSWLEKRKKESTSDNFGFSAEGALNSCVRSTPMRGGATLALSEITSQ